MKKSTIVLTGLLALSSIAGAQTEQQSPRQEAGPTAEQNDLQQSKPAREAGKPAQRPVGKSNWGQAAEEKLQAGVNTLDKARSVNDYYRLESYFVRLGQTHPGNWLPWYYAAFCNAQIGFLYEKEGEKISPYSNRGEQQIKKALGLLDSARQKAELAEVYVVMNRIYQSKVFINPMTYGQKYGVLAQQCMQRAQQLSPENPRAVYLEAWFKNNAPKMYGGDKEKAKELAGKAMELLAASTGTGTAPHWGERECRAILEK